MSEVDNRPSPLSLARPPLRILERKVGDELFLFSPAAGGGARLGGMAIEVWDLTSTPITTTELCRILQGRYEVEPHLLAQDLDEVLGQLGNAELLVGLDGSPSSTAVRTEPVED